MSAKQLAIQFDELSEESSIGAYTTIFFHSTNSLHECQVLLQHQVSKDQGGRAAHSYVTMHQNFAWESEIMSHTAAFISKQTPHIPGFELLLIFLCLPPAYLLCWEPRG